MVRRSFCFLFSAMLLCCSGLAIAGADNVSFIPAYTGPLKEVDMTDSRVIDAPPRKVPWVSVRKDILYSRSRDLEGQPLNLHMDLLVPQTETPLPAVVFVVGGAFLSDRNEQYIQKRLQMAEAGYVVASIEYHIVQNGRYYDGIRDVKEAVRFLRTHAQALHIDSKHIALWGESAGGYLVAMAGLTGGDTFFEPVNSAYPGVDDRVQAVIDTYGISDPARVADDFDDTQRYLRSLPSSAQGAYIHGRDSNKGIMDDPQEAARANPLNYASQDDPPFLLLHGVLDRLVSPSQSLILHEALLKARVDSIRYVVRGAGHDGPRWAHPDVMKVLIRFLDKELK